jgi:hypothetical protein
LRLGQIKRLGQLAYIHELKQGPVSAIGAFGTAFLTRLSSNGLSDRLSIAASVSADAL